MLSLRSVRSGMPATLLQSPLGGSIRCFPVFIFEKNELCSCLMQAYGTSGPQTSPSGRVDFSCVLGFGVSFDSSTHIATLGDFVNCSLLKGKPRDFWKVAGFWLLMPILGHLKCSFESVIPLSVVIQKLELKTKLDHRLKKTPTPSLGFWW